jgi:hypothetical protein
MNSRTLMSASALAMASLGLPCIFAPELVLQRLAGGGTAGAGLMVQLAGAMYLGFAGLNWMGRGSLMGGIYGRPVAIGNLMHFLVGAFALLKMASQLPTPLLSWGIATGYVIFAAWFAFVAFGNPLRTVEGKST